MVLRKLAIEGHLKAEAPWTPPFWKILRQAESFRMAKIDDHLETRPSAFGQVLRKCG
jgi:hypothetical protein